MGIFCRSCAGVCARCGSWSCRWQAGDILALTVFECGKMGGWEKVGVAVLGRMFAAAA